MVRSLHTWKSEMYRKQLKTRWWLLALFLFAGLAAIGIIEKLMGRFDF